MTDEKAPDVKWTPKDNSLRDSIVMRLKAHDAAVRSTLSTEKTLQKDQVVK